MTNPKKGNASKKKNDEDAPKKPLKKKKQVKKKPIQKKQVSKKKQVKKSTVTKKHVSKKKQAKKQVKKKVEILLTNNVKKQMKEKLQPKKTTLYCVKCRKPQTGCLINGKEDFPTTCPSCGEKKIWWTKTTDTNDNADYLKVWGNEIKDILSGKWEKDQLRELKKKRKESWRGKEKKRREELGIEQPNGQKEEKPLPYAKDLKEHLQIRNILDREGLPDIRSKPVHIFIKELLYEEATLESIDGKYSKKHDYSLYHFEWGKGQRPGFLIARPTTYVKVGAETDMYLRPATFGEIYGVFGDELEQLGPPRKYEQDKLIYSLADKKLLWLKTTEGEGKGKERIPPYELFDTIMDMHDDKTLFFTPTQALSREEILALEDPNDLIHKALSAGFDKDERIIDLANSGIPIVINDPSRFKPRLFMPYNPHTIANTSSKTSKTSTTGKTGKLIERPTTAGLVGFSLAHGEPKKGLLHRENRSVIIDGLEESLPDERVGSGLLNGMETGEVDQARGQGVSLRTYATLIFLSNPSLDTSHDEDQDWFTDLDKQIIQFDKTLEIIHQNQQAIGSRIGHIIYDNEMKEATGDGLPPYQEESYDKFLQSIQALTPYSFTQLLLNREAQKWLHTICDKIKDYRTRVESISNESGVKKYRRIHDFMIGQQKAYKHIKGMALRMAYMDNLKDMLQIEYGERLSDTFVQMVLKDAERNLDTVLARNLQSFQKISLTLTDQEIVDKLYEARLSSLKARGNKYEEILLVIASHWRVTQKEDDSISPVNLSELKPYFLACYSREERRNTSYSSFNQLVEAIEFNTKKVNRHTQWHGLKVQKISGIIRVAFSETYNWYKFVENNPLYTIDTDTDHTDNTDTSLALGYTTVGDVGSIGVGTKPVLGVKNTNFNENEGKHGFNNWKIDPVTNTRHIPPEQLAEGKTAIEELMSTKPATIWTLEDLSKGLNAPPDIMQELLHQITESRILTGRIRRKSPDKEEYIIKEDA